MYIYIEKKIYSHESQKGEKKTNLLFFCVFLECRRTVFHDLKLVGGGEQVVKPRYTGIPTIDFSLHL